MYEIREFLSPLPLIAHPFAKWRLNQQKIQKNISKSDSWKIPLIAMNFITM